MSSADYSSQVPSLRSPIQLDRGTPAGVAARQALAHLFALLRAYEDRVRRPLDAEPLHDFRVVVRRLRSVLRELAEVFPAADVERLRAGLDGLGRASGPRRDFDVLAASWAGYVKGLPTWVRSGLYPLEELGRRRRAQEQDELAAALLSERYLKWVKDWERFLARKPRRLSAAAARPIGEVVAMRLEEVVHRVLRRAEKVDAQAPPEALHRLRIAAKRLRYLLEVFRALFDPSDLSRALKTLRGVQDALGAYNDLVTHQRMIHTLASEVATASPPSTDSLLAIGYLLAVLDRRLARARRRAEEELSELLRSSRRERLLRLAAKEEPT